MIRYYDGGKRCARVVITAAGVLIGCAVLVSAPPSAQGYSLAPATLQIIPTLAVITEITDCNSNGIDDADDIASATSTDCNSNGIPDECLFADCALLDLAIIIDTSGSMQDEEDALCCLIEQVVADLASNGLTVNYEILNFAPVPQPQGITTCGAPC